MKFRFQKCFYPLNVPTEVFWTKRTMEQMKEGLIPLPNIHLLPKEWHHLYPNLFGPGRKADPAPDFCHASECQRAAGPSKVSTVDTDTVYIHTPINEF